jgi:hypothetical protein
MSVSALIAVVLVVIINRDCVTGDGYPIHSCAEWLTGPQRTVTGARDEGDRWSVRSCPAMVWPCGTT